MLRANMGYVETKLLNQELTDGVITLRRPQAGDAELLVAGRDDEFRRFMGGGSEPVPTAVVLDGASQVVGWIDYDVERGWLGRGEVNIGYHTFPEQRGQRVAQRSLLLLLSALAQDEEITTATLLIDPANAPSIAVAHRTGFERHGDVDGQILYKRIVR